MANSTVDLTALSSETDNCSSDDLNTYPSEKKEKRCGEGREVKHILARTVPHDHGGGERVIMTDDEDTGDGVYEQFVKRRKVEAGKNRPKGKGRGKAVGKGAKMMGIDTGGGKQQRSKPGRLRQQTISRKYKEVKWRYSDDEQNSPDEELDEKSALPKYLHGRKAELVKAKAELERGEGEGAVEGVFCTPPNYDGIEFSDDEDCETRPAFDTARAAYEDILMPESQGIIPAPIAQHLRGYQVEGVRFLHRAFVFQDGCILGDDMGLGKTVQVIAFLTAAFGKTGTSRDAKCMRRLRRKGRWCPKVLIICPSTLIANWIDELTRWGWWTVYVYHGSADTKAEALRAAEKGSLEIMITNYDTYRLRSEEVNAVHWDCVVADECHKLKERASETTQRMNEINALCRIGLTGTAIQNRYEELWTLLNWARPGGVGTLKEWEQTVARPLLVGQTHNATFAQIGKARRVAGMLVNNLLPRMFLRRMKSLIAHQLPKKTDKVVFCPLTPTQRDVYESYLSSPTVRIIRDGALPCECGSGKKQRTCCMPADPQGRKVNELVFPAIIWLQKLSNHLANWIPDAADPPHMRAQKLELLELCLPERAQELTTRSKLLNYMDPTLCGKWAVLQRLLAFWHRASDKVLIFSHSLALLAMLHALFRATAYNVSYLDGGMALADRAAAVAEFNSDPAKFVFLISTRAGGVGLNITSANKVVIFDPTWNPAHDLQAQDRAFRLGQRRDVDVLRLVSAGTIEEVVYARQVYKQQQAAIGYGASNERRYFTGVMGDKNNQGELFGMANLFTYRGEEAVSVLQGIVNKTNVAERKAGVLVVDAEAEVAAKDAEAAFKGLVEGELDRREETANNPIAAILSSAGVKYSHENTEVIGSSTIEAQISARALAAGEHMSQCNLQAFESSSSSISSSDDDGKEGRAKKKRKRYKPPLDVRRRQFCEMAKHLGFADVQEFALVVEGWSKRERERALLGFYKGREQEKGEMEKSMDDTPPPPPPPPPHIVPQAEAEDEIEDNSGSDHEIPDSEDERRNRSSSNTKQKPAPPPTSTPPLPPPPPPIPDPENENEKEKWKQKFDVEVQLLKELEDGVAKETLAATDDEL